MRKSSLILLLVSGCLALAESPVRDLTEAETLKLQLAQTKIQLLQERYRIAEYQKELKTIADEQDAAVIAICESVGVPKEEVKSGKCQIDSSGKTPQVKRVQPKE